MFLNDFENIWQSFLWDTLILCWYNFFEKIKTILSYAFVTRIYIIVEFKGAYNAAFDNPHLQQEVLVEQPLNGSLSQTSKAQPQIQDQSNKYAGKLFIFIFNAIFMG